MGRCRGISLILSAVLAAPISTDGFAQERSYYLLRFQAGALRAEKIDGVLEVKADLSNKSETTFCTDTTPAPDLQFKSQGTGWELSVALKGERSSFVFEKALLPMRSTPGRITRTADQGAPSVAGDSYLDAWQVFERGRVRAQLVRFRQDRLGLHVTWDGLELFPANLNATRQMTKTGFTREAYKRWKRGDQYAPGTLNASFKAAKRDAISTFLSQEHLELRDDFQNCPHEITSAKIKVPFFLEFYYADRLQKSGLFEFVYPVEIDVGGPFEIDLITSPTRFGISEQQFINEMDQSSVIVSNHLKSLFSDVLKRAKDAGGSVEWTSMVKRPFSYKLAVIAPQNLLWGKDKSVWEEHEFALRFSPAFGPQKPLKLEVTIQSQKAKYGLNRLGRAPPKERSYDLSSERAEKVGNELGNILIDRALAQSGLLQ